MVSRFQGKVSPLKMTLHMTNPLPMATFNMPLTKEQLINKVDVVAIIGTNDPITLHAYPTPNEQTSSNRLAVTDSDTNPTIGGDILIEGDSLSLDSGFANQESWIFDIDFDNQHRKFFEKTSGVYLLKNPIFAEQQSSDPAGWVYPVVDVQNYLSEDCLVNISFFVPDSQNMVPMCAKADYSDIDVANWIADMSFRKASKLVEELMHLEYFLPDAVTIEVKSNDSQVGTIEGDWNLFTDGSVYVPLLLTSRLPGGSPLIVNMDSEDPVIETPKMVCAFNRPTTYAELLLHDFKAVTSDILGHGAQTWPFIKYNANQYCFGDDEEGGSWVELRNNGTELWAILTSVIWDVDLDNQFKRPLRIVDESESGDYAFRTILTPDYINDNPYQFVLGFQTDGDEDYICIPINNSSEIRVWDPTTNSYVYRQSEIQTDGLIVLLENMYRLEFIMPYGGRFREQENMPEDLPNGTFDMFTDSEVIV